MQNPNTADTTKTCSKCGQVKPLSEYTNKRNCRDGLNTYCKGCAANYARAYRVRHPDRDRGNHAKWRAEHADHYRAYQRAYHREWEKANRDKVSDYRREYRRKLRERAL